MNIKEIMTSQVESISSSATIRDAARIMDDVNIGILPVCDDDRLVGVISDRDIVIRSTSAGQDPNLVRVRDTMTAPVIFCFEDQSEQEAVKIMRDNDIRRLPVLDRNKRLVGILTIEDLARNAINVTEILGRLPGRSEGVTKAAA